MAALERTVRGLVRWLAEPGRAPTTPPGPAAPPGAPQAERRFTVVEPSGAERPPRRPGPPRPDRAA